MTAQERLAWDMMVATCMEFVRKVENGEARSVRTYGDCRRALEAVKQATVEQSCEGRKYPVAICACIIVE